MFSLSVENKNLKKNTKVACFFCATPYQLLTAILLVKELGKKGDLYIIPHLGLSDIVQYKVKKYNFFDKVYSLKDNDFYLSKYLGVSKKKYVNWYKKICFYCNIDVVGKEIFQEESGYRVICATTPLFVIQVAYLYLRKHFNAEYVHFEDGEGSYDFPNCADITTFVGWKDKLVRKILFDEKKGISQTCYLYSPELYRKLNPDSDLQIEKIPYIWDKPEMQQLAKDIFGVTENEFQTNDIVLLDTVHNEVFQDAGEQEIKTIYEKIFNCFSRENILIKPHPRDTAMRYDGCKYSQQTSAPFEVLAMEVDMNTKLLIGFGSTSFVNSKIMKDEEPYILLLYKLVNRESQKIGTDESRSDSYYHAVKSMYRNPEKFMIPETMEELDECLEKLKEIYVEQ